MGDFDTDEADVELEEREEEDEDEGVVVVVEDGAGVMVVFFSSFFTGVTVDGGVVDGVVGRGAEVNLEAEEDVVEGAELLDETRDEGDTGTGDGEEETWDEDCEDDDDDDDDDDERVVFGVGRGFGGAKGTEGDDVDVVVE